MFSTWWTNLDSLPSHAQGKQTKPPQTTTTFHSPKLNSLSCASGLETRLETDHVQSVNSLLTSGTSSTLEDEGNMYSNVSHSERENIRHNVINVRIPLPSDNTVQLFQHCFSTRQDGYSFQHRQKSPQGTDSPRLFSSSGYEWKRFGKGEVITANDQYTKVKQPALNNVGLVDFCGVEQPTHMQPTHMQPTHMQPTHMQQPAKSSNATVPSLTESQFMVDMFRDPASPSVLPWKDLHSHPSPLPQTPYQNHNKTQPIRVYPDLSKQSYPLSVDHMNCHTSMHNIQDCVYRPIFDCAHHGASNQSSPKLYPCNRCLLFNTRPILPSSLALNGYRHLQSNLTPRRLSLIHGTANNSVELPSLNIDSGKSDKELTSLTQQVQELSMLKCRPNTTITQRRVGMVPLRTALKNRSRKAVPKYPDPFVGGVSSYQRRLCQLAILVSETVQHEKEKVSQKAKKAGTSGGDT